MDKVFTSITSQGILHDKANFLTELMLLNSNLLVKDFPWRKHPIVWGKSVACIKKLVRDFGISYEQLGCYIYRCSVTKIDANNFAKMAVMAQKLIPSIELGQIRDIYVEKRSDLQKCTSNNIAYKKNKTKSLHQFLEELENGSS
jgi:hypothetical protein